MTIERTPEYEQDPDATVRMPKVPQIDEDLEDVDPEQTLVREQPPGKLASDWESRVIRRVAPRVAAVRKGLQEDEERFGWESDSLRRLSRELD
ncbi:MAG TPA: hypothetical protein VK025_07290 [Steroidobacter sp.]|jgi:hypothetical protein|nr:hypothetical protein [Steroidobacteraceae bacterium]HLS81190.1 hypothetical protein [Steroidobacter sp.]